MHCFDHLFHASLTGDARLVHNGPPFVETYINGRRQALNFPRHKLIHQPIDPNRAGALLPLTGGPCQHWLRVSLIAPYGRSYKMTKTCLPPLCSANAKLRANLTALEISDRSTSRGLLHATLRSKSRPISLFSSRSESAHCQNISSTCYTIS